MTAQNDFIHGYHAHFTRTSNQRLTAGIHVDVGHLPDPSEAYRLEGVAEAKGLLSNLDAIEAEGGGFDFETQLDLDLARLSLESEIHKESLAFGGRPQSVQRPKVGDTIGDPLFTLMIDDPRHPHERLKDVLGRIDGVPEHCKRRLVELDQPVKRWADLDRQTVGGLPDLLRNIVAWAKAEAFPDLRALERAIERAQESLVSYSNGLKALGTTDQFHLETKDAERLIALHGNPLSMRELHQMATRFLATNKEEVEALRGRLVSKYGLPADTTVQALAETLRDRFAAVRPGEPVDKILDEYRHQNDEIVAFIRERDLFPIPEHQKIMVVRTPPFMVPTIPAGAMTSPPPFREGIRQSIVYLTLDPDRIREHTHLDIRMMMVHEGIPGHHLQLATASLHPSTIRKHANFMDQAEGWTTMLEDYMLDVGLGGDLTDEMRLFAKRDIARLGARVAIDLFFMTGERGYLDVGVDAPLKVSDPFEAAAALLRAVTGFGESRIQAELNFYSLERGYPLSYLTGNHLVWGLKRDLEAAQKGELEGLPLDRVFHRVFLEAGNMPVQFMRRVFEDRGLL